MAESSVNTAKPLSVAERRSAEANRDKILGPSHGFGAMDEEEARDWLPVPSDPFEMFRED